MAGSFTGAAFTQIVQPRTGTTDGAGWCHRMARAVFDAPLVYGLDSATKAANATQFRHATRKMPNVAVPVWFDHWGTYGGVFGNWGHVVIWVPGRGFLTSPWYLKHGQEWYSTLEEIERIFGARFRFWSEDINDLCVAEPTPLPAPLPLPLPRKGKTMFLCHYKDAAGPGEGRWAFFGAGLWFELSTKAAVERFKAQNGIPKDVHSFECGNEANWVRFQRVTGIPADEIVHAE